MQALQKKQADAQALRELLSKNSNRTVEERVDFCKHLQYEEHQPLFAVLYSSIHKAAADNSVSGLKHFLNSRTKPKVHIDDYDKNGLCAIHIAAERGCNDALQYLIEQGCSIDLRTTYGNTAIMYACKENKLETIQLLFELGAGLHLYNRAGLGAIHMSAQGDHIEALNLLLELVGEHHQRRKEMNLDEESSSMVDSGGGMDMTDSEHMEQGSSESYTTTTAQPAAGHPEASDLLMHASTNGTTPLHIACLYNAQRVAECLLQHKVKIDCPDSSGETPMHLAGRKGFFRLYRLLQHYGGSEQVRNNFGETPSDLLKDDPAY